MVMGPAVAQEGWEAARQTVIAVPHIEPDGCRAAVSQVLSATGSKKKVLSATSGGLAAGLPWWPLAIHARRPRLLGRSTTVKAAN